MRCDEGTTYNFPAVSLNDNNNKHWEKGITFELQGLPMIHENGYQPGVGARGWYNSAVLSAMLLSVLSSSSNDDNDNDNGGNKEQGQIMRQLLKQDLEQLLQQQANANEKSPTVLEIGAGAIGLVGMTMAWILAHKQQQQMNQDNSDDDDDEREEKSFSLDGSSYLLDDESKVILTDNDQECLTQLQCNVNNVLQSLLEFNSVMEQRVSDRSNNNNEDEEEKDSKQQEDGWSMMSDDAIPFLSVPSIQAQVLDWDDHDVPQEVLTQNKIDFVVGAELAYLRNNCLALQVAKILELNPKAVVWIVQFPRNGWFQVFEQQLRQASPKIQIHKSNPIKVDGQVHELAQSIMPVPVGFGSRDDESLEPHEKHTWLLEDIKALRISIKQEEEKNVQPTVIMDLNERIQQAKRLSQQLNAAQEFSLESHWELGL